MKDVIQVLQKKIIKLSVRQEKFSTIEELFQYWIANVKNK